VEKCSVLYFVIVLPKMRAASHYAPKAIVI
jgi:hypothetical protein